MDDDTKVNIRLHNYPESMIALKNLKAAYIGNFHIAGLVPLEILMPMNAG